MKNLLTCFLFSLLFFFVGILSLRAQQDSRIAKTQIPTREVAQFTLPIVDNKALLTEELENRAPGRPPRFAKTTYANITPSNNGTWEDLPNGMAVWRMRISSKGAKSLNLGFSTYYMPKGGTMVLYSPDQQHILGPFSPADNEDHAQLWTPVLEGDRLIIEVQVPQSQKSNLGLTLNSINHDFLGFSTFLSGACNIDVICGAADGLGLIDEYRDIIQSVGVYGFNGSTFCTGFLVNNTAQDCKPYFMTADHCGVSSGNAPSMVVYWNFQNSTCRQPGSSSSGANGNGVLATSNSGAIFRAGWSGADFTLVELDDPVNPLANAFFAGWDRSTNFNTDSVVCVHHPNTDEKRISFEFDDTFVGTAGGNPNPNSNYVVIGDWDLGTTESGSSGAPLFDKNKRVIGQLFGGQAACGNNAYDAYGWINRSWTGGGSASSRLSDWLDPMGSGVQTLDGRNCAISMIPDQVSKNSCSPAEINFVLSAGSGFGANVTLSTSGLPTGFSTNFSPNPVAPGNSSTLTVVIPSGYNGSVDFDVNSTDGVESSTTGLNLMVTDAQPLSTTLSSPADAATAVSPSTLLEWAPQTGMSYDLEISTDSTFGTITFQAMNIADPSYQLAGSELAEETQYFWRVRGVNPCGSSDWSPVFTFTTGALLCDVNSLSNLNISISSGPPNTVTSPIIINDNKIISSVKVMNLGITHTYVEDLIITLTSPAGTVVTLMSEVPCVEENLLLSFDDGATDDYSVLAGTCNSSSPALSGTFQPLSGLSSFIGESSQGLWTLTVQDEALQDGGSLDQWTLEICAAVPNSFGVNTSEETICSTDTVSFQVDMGNSFQGAPVTLSANNLPTGASVVFDPGVGAANSSAFGQLFGFTDAGDYQIEIIASNANDTRTHNILVHVLETAEVSLLTPTDLIGGLSINPVLVWNAQDSADSYRVEIATDANFSNIVSSNPTTDTTWTTPDLEYGTNYFWRVVGINTCGENAGQTRSFGTGFRVGLEKELGGSIKVFPNPSREMVQVQLPGLPSGDLTVDLYSMDGKQIFSRNWKNGSLEETIDMSRLGAGIYILEIRQGNLRFNKKLVRTP